MSTVLSIQVGALTRSRTYQNDTKAQAALLEFYLAKNLGPAGATNAQKLDAIIDWIALHVQGAAQARQLELSYMAARAQIEDDYTFE
jgi:hypothetical protein